MSDLNEMLAKLRNLEADPVSPGQVERTIRQGNQRYRRQERTRIAVLTLAAMIIAGVAGTLTYRARSTPQVMHLADGSRIMPLSDTSKVSVVSATAELVEVAVQAGATRFDVTHDPKRLFQVVAEDVRVEVIGTRFVVGVSDGDVSVRVERGRVRVTSKGRERVLSAGDSVAFARDHRPSGNDAPPPAQVPPPPDAPEPEPAQSPEAAPSAPEGILATHDGVRAKKTDKDKSDAAGWRASAARGNYDTAYGQLRAGGAKVVRDVPEELMLAADVARWSKHPAEAVPYLERLIREHKSDPRSQLAAFTLVSVLIDELGGPREAAYAFGRSRALDANGPLAGDALAREVEAWSRAGDNANALARAEEYLARYPKGPHAASVRRFGRLE